jgi:putative DNA primase/helicase
MLDTESPPRFDHYPENVPDELKSGEVWVCCDEEKVPLVAARSGAVYAASSTDPKTWRTYEEAYGTYCENEWSFAGIGRVIRAEEDLVGVDLDKCLSRVDTSTGVSTPPTTPKVGLPTGVSPSLSVLSTVSTSFSITSWAANILERLDSYAEVSPSLTGVKVWVKAPSITRAHVKPGLEIYPRGRYFTVTGLSLGSGAVKPIAHRDEELAAIITQEFPKVDRNRRAYDGTKRALDLLDYLEKANVEIHVETSDGTAERVYGIRCPWAHEHTTETSSTATRVGQYSDGATFFECEHAHCKQSRKWKQFRAECDPIVYLGRPRRSSGRLR